MRAISLLFVAPSVAAVAPLAAQSSATTSDSLLRRIWALDTEVLARRRVLDSVRRAVVRPLPGAVVRVGPVNVRTTTDLEPRVRRAAESVARLAAATGDSTVAARIAGHTSIVVADSAHALFGMSPVLLLRADTGRRWSAARQTAPVTATSAQLADRLMTFAEQFALQGADSALSAWVMVGRVPLRPPTAEALADAYIELATVESAVVRRCAGGHMASCLDALGIDSMPGTRLERWYAPADYRALSHRTTPPGDSVAVAAWLGCRRMADQSACIVAARALPEAQVPLPLSASTRFIFLREVLRLGGPGAYDRLLASRGTLDVRLARAAKRPLDAVARQWLDGIDRARSERMRVTPPLALASLGWCGALIALALVRRGSWT